MKYEKTYLVQNTIKNTQDDLTANEVIDQAQYWAEKLLSDQQNNSASETAYYLNQKTLLKDSNVSRLNKIKAAREILEIVNIYVSWRKDKLDVTNYSIWPKRPSSKRVIILV